jgi:MFS family permease
MKGVAQALLYCLTAAGGFVGDLGGGATVKANLGGAGGWRWNLYLSGIFHVVGAGLLLVFYRPLPVKHEVPYMTRLKKLDFVGCLLFAIGWCLL